MDLRPLTLADDEAAGLLSSVAYGYEPGPPRTEMPAGRTTWGAFLEGRLVAIATELEQEQWFGGRLVPAAGIAGVAVQPELRGRGLARLVVEAAAQGGRTRRAVISSLYPTAPALYRSLGWEQVGALTWWDLPTVALRGISSPLPVRAATTEDLPLVQATYEGWGRQGNGVLRRHPPSLEAPLSLTDGGYVSWERRGGYRDDGELVVADLLAETAEARQSLLSFVGSFAMVAPVTRIRLDEQDPLHWQLPVEVLRQSSRQPWMLRLLDPAGAVAARGWDPNLTAKLSLDLPDGPHVLHVDDGVGRLEPGGAGHVRFSQRGLAVWWAGGVPCRTLRRAGLVSGPDNLDWLLDLLTAGPRPELADYF